MPRIFVTPWASSSRPGSVRAVRAVGQDGLAIRTGQLRSTPPRLTRTRCRLRIHRVTLAIAKSRVSASRRLVWRTTRASSAGVAFTVMKPISDVPCRHRGHHLAGSRTDGQLTWSTPLDVPRAFTRATKTAVAAHLAVTPRWRSGRLPSYRERPGTNPVAFAMGAIFWKALHGFAHRSHLGAAARVRQHMRAESSLASVTDKWIALRLLSLGDARCVGPTSAISRYSYEHPRLVGSRCVKRLRASAFEEIACITFRPIRFGGSHVVSCWSRRGGRCLPAVTRANRASDDPCRLPHRAYAARAAFATVKAAKIARIAFAWTKRVAAAIRGVFHRVRTVAPQRPLGRPASDFACIATWPPQCRRSTPFHSCRLLRATRSQSPVHASRCHRRRASLSLGEAYRLLQPSSTRGHTRRAFDPRTRVRLSPRYSPAPTSAGCVGIAVRCRTVNLRATVCTRGLSLPALHLRGRVRPWAEAPEQRQVARSWTIRACPPHGASSTRVAEANRHEVWTTSQLVAPA